MRQLFKKVTRRKALFLSALLMLTPLIYADDPDTRYNNIYFSAGGAMSDLGNNSSVAINSFQTNTYNATSSSSTNSIFGIAIGHEFAPSYGTRNVKIVLGLGAHFINLGTVKGIESPLSNLGDFDTLNYQFSASSTAIMAETRFVYSASSWRPYLLTGLGGAWNSLSGYAEVPTDSNSGASPASHLFTDNTQGSFAYEIGVGILHPIYHDRKNEIIYDLGLDYRYLHLGNAQLGLSSSQTTTDHLQANNMNAQAIMFTLSASFGYQPTPKYLLSAQEVNNINRIQANKIHTQAKLKLPSASGYQSAHSYRLSPQEVNNINRIERSTTSYSASGNIE